MGCAGAKAADAGGPTADPAAQLRSFVVWGAKDVPSGDVASSADPYCVARVGRKGSGWAEKPRSGGRRSQHAQGTQNPEWRMGFTVDLRGIQDPEVHVRIYDKDFVTADDFLGEARIGLRELGDEARKELPLTASGKQQGSVSLGSGPVGFLEKQGVKPSSFYEALHSMGEVKPVKIDEITAHGAFRVGGDKLPEALRGLFWLSGQEKSSAIASFGGPSNDGGGCSSGQLSGNVYKIRVGGDRVWSLADQNLTSWKAVEALDLIYHFVFDDGQNPTKCQIYPEAGNLNITLTAEWLMDYEMELQRNSPDYPGSVVWKRLSSILGMSGGEYDLVQVMDQNGKRLEPAWSKFVEYMNSDKTGSHPGTIFYREIP